MGINISKPLKAGDVIASAVPVVHIIDYEFKAKYCDNCIKRSDDLKKCSKCRQLYYCDVKCQSNDWRYHKKECKVLRHENFNAEEVVWSERLLLRLWLYVKTDESFAVKRHKLFDGRVEYLNDLESIKTKYITEDMDLMIHFQEICDHFIAYGLDFNRKELLHWFSIISNLKRLSSLKISTHINISTLESIGIGFYPQFLSITHSCVPNSALISKGFCTELRAMKDIGLGEQLTMSFVSLGYNKTQRTESLKQLSIKCHCLKCDENKDSDIDYEIFRQFKELFTQFGDKKERKVAENLLKLISNVLSVCDVVYGEYNPNKTYIICIQLEAMLAMKYPLKQVEDLMTTLLDNIVVTHGDDSFLKSLVVHKLLQNSDKYPDICSQKLINRLFKLYFPRNNWTKSCHKK